MNRNFVSFIMISLLFLGVACMQQKNIEPSASSESSLSHKMSAQQTGTTKGGNGMNTLAGPCGTPHNIFVVNPYTPNNQQVINITWDASPSNIAFNLKIWKGTVLAYAASNIIGTSHTPTATFQQNTQYRIIVEGICSTTIPPIISASIPHDFVMTGGAVGVIGDNIDDNKFAPLAKQLMVSSDATGCSEVYGGVTYTDRLAKKANYDPSIALSSTNTKKLMIAPVTPNSTGSYIVICTPVTNNTNWCTSNVVTPTSTKMFRINYLPILSSTNPNAPLGIEMPYDYLNSGCVNCIPLNQNYVVRLYDGSTCPIAPGNCVLPAYGNVTQTP